MNEPSKIPRLLLESAATLASSCGGRHILVAVDALPDLETLPPRTVLIVRDGDDRRDLRRLEESARAVVEVPNVELDRMGQVKLAAIIAISERLIELDDLVVFLTGPFRSRIDALVVMRIGAEYELFDTTEQPELDESVSRAVFHRVLSLALEMGQHGREGRRVGALLVVGDHQLVCEQSEQMILNPFKGYTAAERNLLDDKMRETVKEFSTLDGAFIIRRNGVIDTAGARLKIGISEGLPPGLGARHAAAAGVTSVTRSIAITVSQSDGTVRVWRAGKLVATFEPTPR